MSGDPPLASKDTAETLWNHIRGAVTGECLRLLGFCVWSRNLMLWRLHNISLVTLGGRRREEIRSGIEKDVINW